MPYMHGRTGATYDGVIDRRRRGAERGVHRDPSAHALGQDAHEDRGVAAAYGAADERHLPTETTRDASPWIGCRKARQPDAEDEGQSAEDERTPDRLG